MTLVVEDNRTEADIVQFSELKLLDVFCIDGFVHIKTDEETAIDLTDLGSLETSWIDDSTEVKRFNSTVTVTINPY